MGPETQSKLCTQRVYIKGITGDAYTVDCLKSVNLEPIPSKCIPSLKDLDDIFENIKRTEIERRKPMSMYAVQMTKEEVEAFARMKGNTRITAVEIESITCDSECSYERIRITGHKVCMDLAPDTLYDFSFKNRDITIREALAETQKNFDLYVKRYVNSLGQKQKSKAMFPGYSAFEPKKIIKNGPAVIVYWKDGSKTIVMKKPDDPDDIYSAFAQALLKRFAGSTTHAHKSIDKMVENH